MLLLCLLPWEMKWFSKIEIMWVPVLGWLMWAARDVGVKRGRASKRQAGDGRVPQATRRAGVGDHLPRRNPRADRRAAAVQGRRLPARDRRGRADPAAWRSMARVTQLRGTTGESTQRPPWSRCCDRSRLPVLACHELKGRVRQRIEAARDRLRLEAGREVAPACSGGAAIIAARRPSPAPARRMSRSCSAIRPCPFRARSPAFPAPRDP